MLSIFLMASSIQDWFEAVMKQVYYVIKNFVIICLTSCHLQFNQWSWYQEDFLIKQAEAETVLSSSFVEIDVRVEFEVGVEVAVEV